MEYFDWSLLHLFSFNGEFFSLDVNTGSILKLDKPAYYFLQKLIESHSFNKATLSTQKKFGNIANGIQEEIRLLIKEMVLFAPSPKFFESELRLKSMCLNVAHSCNFACGYCFAKKGSYGGNNEIMSLKVAKKAIDYLHDNSLGHETLEIDFFGGEPFLAFDTVKKAVEYANNTYKDKKWRFTITTNSSLLTKDKEKFLYDNNVSIVLSLDGKKETNDRYRVLKDGSGTFILVANKSKRVAEHRADSGGYYVRGTYTHTTLEISKTVKDIHDLGFKYISLEPVVSKEPGIAIKESDIPKLRKEYECLSNEYVESQKKGLWNFFHFNVDLEAGPCTQKRIHGCGAGVEYIAVSPDGSIYPCHQFDGIEETKLGNILEGITNKKLQEKFRKANFLFNKRECKACWAKFYCSGGCLANNYSQNRDIFRCYKLGCDIQKIRIEAALYVQCKLRELGTEMSTTQFESNRELVR